METEKSFNKWHTNSYFRETLLGAKISERSMVRKHHLAGPVAQAVIPALWEAEAGRSLEVSSSRLA